LGDGNFFGEKYSFLVAQILWICWHAIFVAFSVAFFYPRLYFLGDSSLEIWITLGSYLFILFSLAAISTLSPWSRVRPVILEMPFFQMLYQGLKINRISDDEHYQPEFMNLSDGGHFENLGLIPLLLNSHIGTIYVADGGHDPEQSCSDLIKAMEFSRKNLKVQFRSLDSLNSDVDRQLLNSFIGERNARKFHFQYKRGDSGGEWHDIYYLKPRPSSVEVPPILPISNKCQLHTVNQLAENNSKNLHGICCSGCHSTFFCGCKNICGEFPYSETSNQFFTPELFEAMHQQGYMALCEIEGLFGSSTRMVESIRVVWEPASLTTNNLNKIQNVNIQQNSGEQMSIY